MRQAALHHGVFNVTRTYQNSLDHRCATGVPGEVRRVVVINADDLGICRGTNEAIRECHEQGVLTSASLMPASPEFDHAVETVVKTCPRLGVGWHINLTSGRCVARPSDVPLLVDSQGRFRRGFFGLSRLLSSQPGAALEQIEIELDAQLGRMMSAGIEIDHVDGHRHVHMIPQLFPVVSRIAEKLDCHVRLSHEPMLRATLTVPSLWPGMIRNSVKRMVLSHFAGRARRHVQTSSRLDGTFGILSSGGVTLDAFKAVARSSRILRAEVLTHPGRTGGKIDESLDAGDRRFLASQQREVEHQTLLGPRVREMLEDASIMLAGFRDLTSITETSRQFAGSISR